ncbi:hypothetical protein [Kribbella sandramycini]|uniref:Uncharacterized protein n=1 Tax=Kribbella sandramycini TaxID=60450 RepID=A0A841SCM5_9ACTN|nr:hypothetical protein [Kribbella sandramycini]MBB6567063.1 hypothetical protein [Kribbella sandramycini]
MNRIKKALATALLGLAAVTPFALQSAPADVPVAGCHQCPGW